MNRSDYLAEEVINKLRNIRERGNYSEARDVYNEENFNASCAENGLDIAEGNRWDEHKNGYLAACIANSAERSGDRFRDNSDLVERNVEVYLGKYDRATAVISREYEDDEGEIIHNHVLIDHQHTNPHLEGVQRMSSAYFNFTNSDVDE